MRQAVALLILFSFFEIPAQQHNVLTQSEKDSGFVLLFDGGEPGAAVWKMWWPGNTALDRVAYFVDEAEQAFKKEGSVCHGCDIMIDSIYSDFIFKFDFKVEHQTGADNANSGVHYRTFYKEGEPGHWASGCGIEYQIMDQNFIANNSTGAAYGIYPPDPYPWRSGEWNQAIIVCNGDLVEHWLNNEIVVSYDMGTSEFVSRVRNSAFGGHTGTNPLTQETVDFATSKDGWIVIQDYGELYDWWFRNIKIARLPIPEVNVKGHGAENKIAAAGAGLLVKVTEAGIHRVDVYDVNGKHIAWRKGSGKTAYSFSDVNPGLYLVRVKTLSSLIEKKHVLVR